MTLLGSAPRWRSGATPPSLGCRSTDPGSPQSEQQVDLEFLAGQLALVLEGQRQMEERLADMATKAQVERMCRVLEGRLERDRAALQERRARLAQR